MEGSEPPWERAARESLVAVEVTLRRPDVAPRVRERLEMVKAVALGYPVTEVARWSRRTDRTVERWLRVFAASGITALADAPRSGRPARADTTYQAALEEAAATAPRTLGLLFDAWTSDRLSAYLAETTGVRIAPGWIRALLGRRRWACGRPKHTLGHLQDPAARTACEQTLQAVEKKGSGGRRRGGAALPG